MVSNAIIHGKSNDLSLCFVVGPNPTSVLAEQSGTNLK